MPPVLPVDQELILKKRARRRLVGAIALVILLMILLPIVLKDRVNTNSNENAVINIAENTASDEDTASFEAQEDLSLSRQALPEQMDDANPIVDLTSPKPVQDDEINSKVTAIEQKAPANARETTSATSQTPAISTEKLNERFTIQVGAYSDINNMKQIQASLIKAGFTTATEKVATAKGDTVRLMVGDYVTRESANEGLLKLKSIGLNGLIKPKT